MLKCFDFSSSSRKIPFPTVAEKQHPLGWTCIMIRRLLNEHPSFRSRNIFLRSLFGMGLCALSLCCSGTPAEGADWVFGYSYYSHSDSPAYTIGLVPQTRSAYRQAYVNLAPHSRISGGWRWNNYQIQNGNSLDNTYMREFYIDSR